MFENLTYLYHYYGGLRAMFRSTYFWLSVVLSLLTSSSIPSHAWRDVAESVMPSLAGFTLASFAIIYAILGPERLQMLTRFNQKGASPIVSVTASIGHAVFVQVASILMAMTFKLGNAESFSVVLNEIGKRGEESAFDAGVGVEGLVLAFSAIGHFLTFYGVILVLATAFSIFRMQLLVAKSTK